MGNVKTKVIPVIIRATGTISKSLRHYLSNIPGKHEIKEMIKPPYWSLHTYCGKLVMSKYRTYFTDEITLHVAITVNTEQLYHCIS